MREVAQPPTPTPICALLLSSDELKIQQIEGIFATKLILRIGSCIVMQLPFMHQYLGDTLTLREKRGLENSETAKMERQESMTNKPFSIESILASKPSKSPSTENTSPAIVSSRESHHQDHRDVEDRGTGLAHDLPRRDYHFAPTAPFSPGHWYPWLHANAYLHYAYESEYTQSPWFLNLVSVTEIFNVCIYLYFQCFVSTHNYFKVESIASFSFRIKDQVHFSKCGNVSLALSKYLITIDEVEGNKNSNMFK